MDRPDDRREQGPEDPEGKPSAGEGPLGWEAEEEGPGKRSSGVREQREPRERPGGLIADAARSARPYTAIVGALFVVLIVVAVVNGLLTSGGETLGVDPEPGEPLPEFAVPEARGPLEGDANVAQRGCEEEGTCPDGSTPACEIEEPRAIRVCDLFDRPLAISFWFTRGTECAQHEDLVDRAWRRHRDEVGFLSVNVRDDRDLVRRLARERGWRMPVGHDADGAVSNLYGIGVCPTLVLARPGGRLEEVVVGEISERELDERLERLTDRRDDEPRAPSS